MTTTDRPLVDVALDAGFADQSHFTILWTGSPAPHSRPPSVALEIHSLPADLPEPNATTLATVVREGVTNVLRHSTASRCAISISNTQTGIGLRIVNDGISHPTDHQPGNGIDNLRSRVGSVGGTFQAGVEPGGTFSLVAELPAG